jgi:hypothetical protein
VKTSLSNKAVVENKRQTKTGSLIYSLNLNNRLQENNKTKKVVFRTRKSINFDSLLTRINGLDVCLRFLF